MSSTAEALELLDEDDSYDFILTMYNVGEPDVFAFAHIVKERHPRIPIALLTSFSKDIYRRIEERDRSALDYIFCWHGNTELIIAIIKLIEDAMNAREDMLQGVSRPSCWSRTPSASTRPTCPSSTSSSCCRTPNF